MDRKIIERISYIDNAPETLEDNRVFDVIKMSIDNTPITDNGCRNLVIAMEEIAELQVELVNALTKKADRFGLIEEFTDFGISLRLVCEICKIDYDKIDIYLEKLVDDFNRSNKLSLYELICKTIKDLGELQKQISKVLRGKEDKTKLTDIYCITLTEIGIIMVNFGISGNELNKSLNVKINKIEEFHKEQDTIKENSSVELAELIRGYIKALK